MDKRRLYVTCLAVAGVLAAVLAWGASPAMAVIEGLTGPSFTLTARQDFITTADGNTLTIWGYANGAARAQYPGHPGVDLGDDQVGLKR